MWYEGSVNDTVDVIMSMSLPNNLELPIAYQKWFAQFDDINTLEVSQWKTVHILAYIAKRYKDYYNVDFSFRMNASAPSKSYDVVQIAKLKQMLSSDPKILKNYVDWIFEKKIIERKKQIRTLAIFLDLSFINEFKWQIVNKAPDRTTTLPQNILSVVKDYDDSIKTYGDLAFARHGDDVATKSMLDKLVMAGFKLDMLEKIK